MVRTSLFYVNLGQYFRELRYTDVGLKRAHPELVEQFASHPVGGQVGGHHGVELLGLLLLHSVKFSVQFLKMIMGFVRDSKTELYGTNGPKVWKNEFGKRIVTKKVGFHSGLSSEIDGIGILESTRTIFQNRYFGIRFTDHIPELL